MKMNAGVCSGKVGVCYSSELQFFESSLQF